MNNVLNNELETHDETTTTTTKLSVAINSEFLIAIYENKTSNNWKKSKKANERQREKEEKKRIINCICTCNKNWKCERRMKREFFEARHNILFTICSQLGIRHFDIYIFRNPNCIAPAISDEDYTLHTDILFLFFFFFSVYFTHIHFVDGVSVCLAGVQGDTERESR